MVQSFNVDGVRRAFDSRESARRQAVRAAKRAVYAQTVESGSDYDPVPSPPLYDSYRYVREVWTDFIIVETPDDPGTTISTYVKIPYTVDNKNNVLFGQEQEVKIDYVALAHLDQEPLWVDGLGDSAVDNLIQLASVRSYTRMINGRAVRVRSYGRKGDAAVVPEKGGSPYTGAGNASSRDVPAPKAKVVVPEVKKDIKKVTNTASEVLKSELRGYNPATITKDYVAKVYYKSKPSVKNALRALYPEFVKFAIKQGEIQKSKVGLSAEHGDAVLKLIGADNG